jgi:glutathione S-transferase
MELHYWPIRGLGYPIINLLAYTGTDYTWVKEENEEAYYASKNALKEGGLQFPNLPYLVHGSKQLSESWAIMAYVVNSREDDKFQSLLPDFTNMTKFFLYKGIIGDLIQGATSLAYKSKSREELKEDFEDWVSDNQKKFVQINKLLEKQKWILGEDLTILDFYFAEGLERIFLMEDDFMYEIVSDLGYLKAYLNRFLGLPGIKELRNSDQHMDRPFNFVKYSSWN